jgi:hypothetical protein
MSNIILMKADHCQPAPWHLSLREISLIQQCKDLWFEVQKNSCLDSGNKLKTLLSEGANEGERNAATFIRACAMRDAGYKRSDVIKNLSKWDLLFNNPPISNSREIKAVVDSVYRRSPSSSSIWRSDSLLELIRFEIGSLNLSPPEFTAVVNAMVLTNTRENEWVGENVEVGQLITSLQSLANRSGVEKSQVRSMLQKIKNAGFIETTVLPDRLGSKWTWRGEFRKMFLGMSSSEESGVGSK